MNIKNIVSQSEDITSAFRYVMQKQSDNTRISDVGVILKVNDNDIMMIKMSYGINEKERTPEDISNILDIDVKNIYKRKSYIFKRIREKGECDVYSY